MSIVYIVALESELPKQHDMDIRYCGVGKVNAAHATMKAIADGATKIVNFGTAGLVCAKELKGLHKVTHIKERDMQAEPQAPRGVTPFEETPFAGEIELSPLREITLGTGDSFVQAPDQWFDGVATRQTEYRSLAPRNGPQYFPAAVAKPGRCDAATGCRHHARNVRCIPPCLSPASAPARH